MYFLSITGKVIIFFLCTISMVVVGLTAFFVREQEKTIIAQNQRAMAMMSANITSGIQSLMESGNALIVNAFVESVRRNSAILDFRILRTNGETAFLDNGTIDEMNRRLGGTMFTPRVQEFHERGLAADDAHLKKSLEEKRILSDPHLRDGQLVMTVLAPILPNERCFPCHGEGLKPLGIMLLTTSLAEAERDIHATRKEALVFGIGALIVVLPLLYWMMHRFLIRPLGRIEGSMERVAGGHLDERIIVPGRDEISRMAATFNAMANQLRRTYQGLWQERNKLRTVIHGVQEGIVVTDASGQVILVNEATERLLKKSATRIAEEGFIHLIDDPEYVGAFLEREGADMPTLLVYKGNALLFHASTLREDGVVIGSAALLRDVSEEMKLKEQFREIIRQAPFGIIVADDRGVIHVFNPASERIFGDWRGDMIGKNLTTLIPPGLHDVHRDRFMRYFQSGLPRTTVPHMFETTALRRDGSAFPIRLAVNSMMLEGGLAIVGMVSDITEEKRLLEDLIQSAKMAGLGSMVAGVAHEINTPVGIGVTAASELLERMLVFEGVVQSEGISEEELSECIASTRRLTKLTLDNLVRAAELVRSFKSVAVDQSNENLRTFRVREYVESTLLTIHHELRHTRLHIEILCDERLEIRCHPGALSQILINLIINSKVHAFAPDTPGEVILEFQAVGDRLRLIYRDNGKGMSEEVRQRIFEPFFTTRRDLGGSGLGMHIVYNLATRTLGGSISCQSAPGCGITVIIDIPLT
ncbi:MAG: PAS domain S-box protein [Magnetococcales bacterium]|nr:PAS domain S-box protein [Magnetococcales bacterium]